ncbi:WG repeat-containing protein [Natronosporangium hydrolyticum]|uniref:WG repeat-containing protein n=2 Tax=Natronosporangium hydrolyticum TaxID=2811111 RepID=A0A895YHV9_9ACTN|nr:WG repeat-containing protein [Natronosporangium hydrolyticum]
MLAPVVVPGQRPGATPGEATEPDDATEAPDASESQPEEPISAEPAPESDTHDPEQVLATYDWRFHHETLREIVADPEELRRLRDQLTVKLEPASDNPTRARLLSLRAVVSRILGDLNKALADGKLALAHAEATSQLRRIAIAQARLAHVHQWRGDFAEADRLFALANSPELPDRLRATMHEHAGRSCYDQGRYIEACNHFDQALELRKVDDPELIARTDQALDAVARKIAENGIGPYPRSKEEILQLHTPPTPVFDEQADAWGYADQHGAVVIGVGYADVQPFRDSVAWVRRPGSETWELIDESGQQLIDASAGWLGVGSFSEGLAWVSRDGYGAWVAIDKQNRVVISTGYEDVRPFRRGVAPVRRGGWGAVDSGGRLLVPCQYAGYATAMTDGRYIDGFTDEGLAIVDAGGGRKGVVDRAGRVIVPPSHPNLVIHPVAFLVSSPTGAWGALDRRGRPLIEPNHPSRLAVMEEIDRLLADTKPVL